MDSESEQTVPRQNARDVSPQRPHAAGPSRDCSPSVSVVMPAFNAGDALAEQLAALLDQHVESVTEIIVVDNRSTDNTRAIVQAAVKVAAANDGWLSVRYVSATARPGAAYARNVGIEASQGQTILFCDADDMVQANWISELARTVETHGAAAGYMDKFQGRTASRETVVDSDTAAQSWHGTALLWPVTCNFGIRRDLLAKVGTFDEDLRSGEDIDLWVRMHNAGVALHQSDARIFYRLRPDGEAALSQLMTYAYWDAFLLFRHRRTLSLVGSSLHSPQHQLRRVLGHVRRLPLFLRRDDARGWLAEFRTRLIALRGYVDSVRSHR